MMTRTDLLAELHALPVADQLAVLAAALEQLRHDFQPIPAASPTGFPDDGMRHRLALAADALLDDYLHDEELTAFTALDGEDFLVEE